MSSSDHERERSFKTLFSKPMPEDGLGRARRLAMDLAHGSLLGLWTEVLRISPKGEAALGERELETYFQEVWADVLLPPQGRAEEFDFAPLLVKLIGMGYLTRISERDYIPSEKAFGLLGTRAVEIFISYSVRQSSSVAMLVWSELHRRGYSPFLDIRNLSGGDEWHGVLEQKVKGSDVFIALLGPATLESEYVRDEIRWASDSRRTKVIPVALEGFDVASLSGEFEFLAKKNLIRVRESTSVEFLGMLNQLLATVSLIG